MNWLKVARFCCRQLTKRDSSSRFYALRDLGAILTPNYRFKWPQMDWWSDAQFNGYLERFGESDGMNCDRRWMLSQLLKLVDSVPGDTAECGVFAGASSYLICDANSRATLGEKRHHMFDSFEGLSQPDAVDGAHWSKGDLAYGVDLVRDNLEEFDNTVYYPGWIPERFADVDGVQFSFVHVDVDLHQPTADSIAFFYPRMSEGGVLLVDDYGFTSCPGATKAADDFLADKPEKMLRLSGGAGFIVKGIRTQSVPPQSAAA